METKINGVLPKTDNYLIEGLRLLLINVVIFLGVGSLSLGLFWVVHRIRLLGFPLPLPVWLILLGAGIPSFIFWFQYGSAFGSLISGKRFTKGLSIGILGDIPGFIIMYVMINHPPSWENPDIFRVIFVLFSMFFLVMPIMVVLGTLNKGVSKSTLFKKKR